MATHLDQYRVYHAQIQADFLEEQRQNHSKLNLSIEHLLERVGSLETRSNAMERLQDALEQRIEFLDDRRDRHADQIGTKIEFLEEQAAQNTSMITQIDKRVSDLELRGEFGTRLTSGYHTGSTAYGNLRSMSNYQGSGDSNTPPQQGEILHSRVVERSGNQVFSSCQELPRIRFPERATYNGVLLWKIGEIGRRRREAVHGTTVSLYSTPFYTSRHGYKMCARIYLNGDGMGKGSHLSFFFVVMRGPFDALLQWPFKQKVTLTLINQNGKKHISDSFRPDPHSSSFQKPGRREMNIASGCPMFIRIDHLLSGGFVKDDAIYVRVVVETMDLPSLAL